MQKEVIKEFIQYDMTVENLKNELQTILNNDEYKNRMVNNFEIMRGLLGGKGASERTAGIIVNSVKEQ